MNTAPQTVFPLAFLDKRATGSTGRGIHQLSMPMSSYPNNHQRRTTKARGITDGADGRSLCVNCGTDGAAMLTHAILTDCQQLATLE